MTDERGTSPIGNWSLAKLLAGLNDDIERRLATSRASFSHPGTKGDASEHVWLHLLETYLPQRYKVATAHVVDSKGAFSDQIDVVVFDRQYSPFIFQYEGQTIIPAESVYAVFEAKQAIEPKSVTYAQKKVSSVRRLHRTSRSIPHAGGVYPPKPLPHIFGGLVTFESIWNPPLGASALEALECELEGRLDIGCVAAHGMFCCDRDGRYTITLQGKPATAFLFQLIDLLQSSATVPMIDIQAYAAWLTR